jgi:hypothetical protein
MLNALLMPQSRAVICPHHVHQLLLEINISLMHYSITKAVRCKRFIVHLHCKKRGRGNR